MSNPAKKPLFKNPSHILIHTLLIIGSIFMVFPFIWMIMTSFKSEDEILKTGKTIVLLPDLARPSFLNGEEDRKRIAEHERQKALFAVQTASGTTSKKVQKPFELFDNYKEAWAAQPFYRYFLNTFLTAITITTFSLIFASLAAYAFAFFKFPFKDQLFMLMLGTMMLPQQALLIPDYIVLSKIHWVNTYMALIVPWLASAYSVFFLRQFFMQLPKDLFEAAMLDGCTRLQFYFKICLPLSKPPMVTLGIFSFLGTWNSFVWPLIVTNDTSLRVLQVGLSYFASEAGTRWGPLMAASTFTIVPLVIMYFLAQRQFVESQAMTGMKE
ncbi:MAG TPA: carbohydrate ABC transporter permease [Candidatus Ozemobacteraceae bacterium]|nr:carbohydrate ABC transporter permease [Candidatus Ozemobacteraceae bacterium]